MVPGRSHCDHGARFRIRDEPHTITTTEQFAENPDQLFRTDAWQCVVAGYGPVTGIGSAGHLVDHLGNGFLFFRQRSRDQQFTVFINRQDRFGKQYLHGLLSFVGISVSNKVGLCCDSFSSDDVLLDLFHDLADRGLSVGKGANEQTPAGRVDGQLHISVDKRSENLTDGVRVHVAQLINLQCFRSRRTFE